jgi:hypothetical protein
MKTTQWNDLPHKGTAEMRAKIEAEAVAELKRVGFSAAPPEARPTHEDRSNTEKVSSLS